MILLNKISNWSMAHNPKGLAFLRVALGIGLLMKGLSFLYHQNLFHDLVTSSLNINQQWVDYTIIWANIIGGFLIVIGLFTRVASLVQIPLILGAIFFVNTTGGYFAFQNALVLSLIILLLLMVFLIEGDGPISLSNYVKSEDPAY